MFVTFGKIETSINNLPKILIILKTKEKLQIILINYKPTMIGQISLPMLFRTYQLLYLWVYIYIYICI